MPIIQLPNDWAPRPWQREVLNAREKGFRRGCIALHRRAGKSDLLLNLACIEAHREPGNYVHIFPTIVQARKALWRGVDKAGRRFMDRVFPPPIRKTIRDNEMQIELLNGSTWQLLGADNPSALVGTNFRGIVLDECALYPDSEVLDYLRPVLAENTAAWMFAISTFRGRNHFYDLFHVNRNNPEWFCLHLDVSQTHEADGTPLISASDIDAERRAGMSDAMVRQEFWLDTTAAFSGAYFQQQMADMKAAKRTGDFPHDPSSPVYVAFDIGFSDHTVAVFFQAFDPKRTVIIGSHAWQFTPAPDIARDIRERYPWGKQIQIAVLPHDARRPGPAGDTWASAFEAFKLAEEIEVLRKAQNTLHSEIALVQQSLPTTYIDTVVRPWTNGKENNSMLLEALAGYRTEKLAKRPGVFSRNPYHSWESHYADAVRYLFVYRHGDIGLGGWGPKPSTVAIDRAAGWRR
jgi:hypothetical protein